MGRTYNEERGVQFVHANGLRFGYLEQGEGPLALLFHGFPDTPHTWSDFAPRLAAAGYRVVMPFLRGYAPTQIPEQDATTEHRGRDGLGLIEALGADSAVLIGHDWGADVVYAATAIDPTKVDKLVTVAIPHPATLGFSFRGLWIARHFLYLRPRRSGVRRMAKNDFAEVRTLYERWSPTHDWPDAEFEAVKNTFSAPGSLDAACGYYRTIDPIRVPDFYERQIPVDTLCIYGADDPGVGAGDFEIARQRFSGVYQVEQLPGGHFCHRESPDQFAERVLGFLA